MKISRASGFGGTGKAAPPSNAVDPEDQAVILGLVPAYEPAHDLGHLARMSGCHRLLVLFAPRGRPEALSPATCEPCAVVVPVL
jgi:hypothetical protein